MSWNYRVVRFQDEVEGEYLEVKEVYYDIDGSLMGYCDATVGAGSVDGLLEVMDMMLADIKKPIIDEEEFKKSRIGKRDELPK